MRAAAYMRVSTRTQDWELQRDAILRAASARGDEIGPWFEEKRSGAAFAAQRPELERLRGEARSGAFRRVYVFQLSRFSRRGARDMLTILDELFAAGVSVVSTGDPFGDLSQPGPMRDIAIAMIGVCAQIELENIRERIAAARERIEAQGGQWGRRRKVDPATLAAAQGMQRQNLSLRVIAARLKVPKSTLSRALHGKGHYASIKTDDADDGVSSASSASSGRTK